MKLDYCLAYIYFAIASLVVIKASSSTEISPLCNLQAAKKMLDYFGINTEKSACLLQQKRDVAHLVTSYLEHYIKPEKRNALNELDELVRKEMGQNEKRVKYCCSPVCDRFMERMGTPSASLIQCT